jgi:hypothetical protein
MPKALEINDQDLIRRIAREQKRRGDKKSTKTASKLLTEYLTLIEHGAVRGSEESEQPDAHLASA